MCIDRYCTGTNVLPGELEPTRPEYPDEDPDGPYCPGEIVNFCYTVNFTVDPIGQGNNCQWIRV